MKHVLNFSRDRRNACSLARFLVLSIVLPLVLAASCLGQATTVILGGKVFDAQERVIPNATVVVTSVERGTQWSILTNDKGSWRVEGLIEGHYSFQVSAPGFKTLQHSAIELQIADQKFVDATLSVGTVTENVVVAATTPLIDTTAGVSGIVITTEQLQELPSQTNSPVELAALSPGVILGLPTGGVPHLWSNTSESALTVNSSGQGTNAINYSIDGGTDTRGATGIAYIPPMDAIAEVRISSNAYDASIGRTSGGTVDMSMKSGTRNIHGVLYEMNQNNTLNAKNYQSSPSTPTPPVHLNEYGGTAGGPIWIPKFYDGRRKGTFFFFSWDGIRNSSISESGFMSLPTAQERQGDFSSSFTTTTAGKVTTINPVQLYDPHTYNPKTGQRSLLNGNGTMIAPGTISSIAKAYLALMPMPNHASDGASSDSNNYVKNDPKVDKFASWALRIDQAWNNNHHTYAEYRWNKWSETDLNPFGPGNPLSGQIQGRENWGFTVDHTWVATHNLVVDARANATAINNSQTTTAATVNPADFQFSQALIGLQQFHGLPYITGIGSGWDGGGMGSFEAPVYNNDRIWEFGGKLTQTHGNHNLRYGADYMIQQQANGTLSNGAGSFSFGTNWTVQNPDAQNVPTLWAGIGPCVFPDGHADGRLNLQ